MINELHVPLITQLNGVRAGDERDADGSRLVVLLASLCLRRRVEDDLRSPDVKRTRQKTRNQTDEVKCRRSYQHPGNNCTQS